MGLDKACARLSATPVNAECPHSLRWALKAHQEKPSCRGPALSPKRDSLAPVCSRSSTSCARPLSREMQQSLKRYVGQSKDHLQPEQQPQPQPAPVQHKRKARSALVTALGAQLVRGRGGGAADAASCDGRSAAPQPAPDAQPLQERPGNLPRVRQQGPPSEHQCTSHSPPAAPQGAPQQRPLPPCDMQACPLCGALLPAGQELQRHVEEELAALEQEEEAAGAAEEGGQAVWHPPRQQAGQPPAGQRQQQRDQQPNHQRPRHDEQPPRQQQQQQPCQQPAAAAVLVLGGAPAVTAPTDRRRLQQLQRARLLPPKRPRQLPAEFANHYDDGRGAWVSPG